MCCAPRHAFSIARSTAHHLEGFYLPFTQYFLLVSQKRRQQVADDAARTGLDFDSIRATERARNGPMSMLR